MKHILNISWRVALALVVFLTVIGGPVYYVLFAPNLLDPIAVFAPIMTANFGLRLLMILVIICVFSLVIGRGAAKQNRNPFLELAESIRRIATRDFNVRLSPSRSRDPREMIALTDAFNEMATALQRSEELRNTLMADVAHELRTPLTVLEGNLRAALDRVYPLDEAEIANLYGQTRHLIQLVNDLHELALAEARRLPLHFEPTDLTAVVSETVQLFAPLAEERGVALRCAAEPLPALPVDGMRMRQVLHNLLSNALRHTPAGGEVVVASRVVNETVEMTVSDTGDGLEPEQLGMVFERFYRTDRSRSRDTGGTGLGLAIVSAIVASHGGTVAATSAGPGQGSAFTIRLPVADGATI